MSFAIAGVAISAGVAAYGAYSASGSNPEGLSPIVLDPAKVQRDTLYGNLANAPKAFELADLANSFSAEQLTKMLEQIMPGYGSLRDKGTENILSMLRGEIPKDVDRQLQQRVAENASRQGTSGSQFNLGNLFGTYGRTSYGIVQEGLDSASRWIASIPKAPLMDFSQMFLNPNAVLGADLQAQQGNAQINKFNNWADSLPSTTDRIVGNALSSLGNFGMNYAGVKLGMGLADDRTGYGLGFGRGSSGYLSKGSLYGIGASEGGGNVGGYGLF